MVKRCSYGLCKSDDRYPERVKGVTFIPFPKPTRTLQKCLRWIKLCGRPDNQLNATKITSNKYVCSKHFVDKTGPTKLFPDPLPADMCSYSPRSPKTSHLKRLKMDIDGQNRTAHTTAFDEQVVEHWLERKINFLEVKTTLDSCLNQEAVPVVKIEKLEDDDPEVAEHSVTDKTIQTDSNWSEEMRLNSLVIENEFLKRKMKKHAHELIYATLKLTESQNQYEYLAKNKICAFSIESYAEDEVFLKYYTGFEPISFDALFKFLVPKGDICPFKYTDEKNLHQINRLSLQNQLFLTLCKLRHNFHMLDMGYRFGLTLDVADVIFKSWVNYMFLRFGEDGFWPHRQFLQENMPEDFKKDFPETFAIVDVTEIKIEKNAVKAWTYGDGKPTDTLKSLVAVDPRGALMFTSMLFSGTMPDECVFIKSGLQSTLSHLIETGYLKKGDRIVTNTDLDIAKEIERIGLRFIIPSLAKLGSTKKIEGTIKRIKDFKILSGRIPLSLMFFINQIWYVCSFLTNFMPLSIEENST